jgi:hypothetical protein
MNKPEDDFKDLEPYFDHLRDTPLRDPKRAKRGRAQYLKNAEILENSFSQPVSNAPDRRLNKRTRETSIPLRQKEHPNMIHALITLVIAAGLFFGGGGATVYAAQDSLPTSPLYAVKTLSEDVRLDFANDPQTELDLLAQFSNRRVDEIVTLTSNREFLPFEVINRLQIHTDAMLRLAAGMQGDEMFQALQRIQNQTQEQVRKMEMVQQNLPDHINPQLAQTHAMLRAQNQIAQQGLEDPLFFKAQFGQGSGQGDQGSDEGSQGSGQGDQGSGEGGQGSGQGDQGSGEGGQGSGLGDQGSGEGGQDSDQGDLGSGEGGQGSGQGDQDSGSDSGQGDQGSGEGGQGQEDNDSGQGGQGSGQQGDNQEESNGSKQKGKP